MTVRHLPELDRDLADRAAKLFGVLLALQGGTVVCDGWSTCMQIPLLNFLLDSGGRVKFLGLHNAQGDTKDADYLCSLISHQIKEVGSHNVVAVVMDGACRGGLRLVGMEYPHIFTGVCPAHSFSLVLQDMFSGAAEVRTIDGATVPVPEGAKQLFHGTMQVATSIVRLITRSQRLLWFYRSNERRLVGSGLLSPSRPALELRKPCPTRFGSIPLVLQRLQAVRDSVVVTLHGQQGTDYVRRLPHGAREKARAVLGAMSPQFWDRLAMVCGVAHPLMIALRVADDGEGRLSQLEAAVREVSHITGHLDPSGDAGYAEAMQFVGQVWQTRMEYLFPPSDDGGATFKDAMEVAYVLDPRYMPRVLPIDGEEPSGEPHQLRLPEDHVFSRVVCKMAKIVDETRRDSLVRRVWNFQQVLGGAVVGQWRRLQAMIAAGSACFHRRDGGAFSAQHVNDPVTWWYNFVALAGPRFEELAWGACRLLSIPCSSSACERNWSLAEKVQRNRERVTVNTLAMQMSIRENARTIRRDEELSSGDTSFKAPVWDFTVDGSMSAGAGPLESSDDDLDLVLVHGSDDDDTAGSGG